MNIFTKTPAAIAAHYKYVITPSATGRAKAIDGLIGDYEYPIFSDTVISAIGIIVIKIPQRRYTSIRSTIDDGISVGKTIGWPTRALYIVRAYISHLRSS